MTKFTGAEQRIIDERTVHTHDAWDPSKLPLPAGECAACDWLVATGGI